MHDDLIAEIKKRLGYTGLPPRSIQAPVSEEDVRALLDRLKTAEGERDRALEELRGRTPKYAQQRAES